MAVALDMHSVVQRDGIKLIMAETFREVLEYAVASLVLPPNTFLVFSSTFTTALETQSEDLA